MNKPTRARLWPRLLAEFLVIVTGVLVALGVDQWVRQWDDRALEGEYLERLLADVQYDVDELAFVRERSRLSADLARLALDEAWVSRAPADSLVGVSYAALLSRTPDLSRSTFNELVSSGRIELLRSREVREALAEYDRFISEYRGFYGAIGFGGILWIWERLPADQRESYEAQCRDTDVESARVILGVCAFDWEIDLRAFRSELQQVPTRRLLRLTWNRNLGGVRITDELLGVAERLRAALAAEVAAL